MFYNGLSDNTEILIHKSNCISLSIKEIYERFTNDMETLVYSFDFKEKKQVIRKITMVYDNKIQDVFRINLTNRKYIGCTLSHRLILYNEEYLAVSYLHPMDELLEINSGDTINIQSIVPLGMRHVYSLELDSGNNIALLAGIYSGS